MKNKQDESADWYPRIKSLWTEIDVHESPCYNEPPPKKKRGESEE